MSVTVADITTGPYAGNGTTVEFSYDFQIKDKSQITVYEIDADGIATELNIDDDYTVDGIGGVLGGTITRTAGPLPTGSSWFIRSNYQPTQETSFTSQSAFYPRLHEASFDKLTYLIHQLEDKLGRTVRVKLSDTNVADLELPSDSERAGKFLGFDSDGNIEITVGKSYIDSKESESIARDDQLQSNIDSKFASVLPKDSEIVQTMLDLLSVDVATSTVAFLLNYHSDAEGGGGVFYWDATKTKSEHNGGTIIDPTATFPTDWSVTTQLATWFDTSNAGAGCWVRQYEGAVDVNWFGGVKERAESFSDNLDFDVSFIDASKTLTTDGKSLKSIRKDITERPPLQTDFNGGLAGNVWKFNNEVWYASRQYQGQQTSWIKSKSVYPIVSSLSNLEACYFTKKVVPEYAGACLSVSFEGVDVPVDIGFDSNGDLDVDALMFVIRSGVGRIHTWYDQSGNGNDLTSTGANRPTIRVTEGTGGAYDIVFENGAVYNGTVIPEQFLTIPNTLTVQSNSVSIVALTGFANSVRTCPLITLDGATSTAIGYKKQTGVNCFVSYVNNSLKKLTGYQPTQTDEILMLGSSGTGINIKANNTHLESYTALPSVTLAGGKVGSSDSGLFLDGAANPVNGGGSLTGFMIFNEGLSSTVMRALYYSLVKKFKLFPQVQDNVVFEGDSITEGAWATYFNNWPRLATEMLPYKFKSYNVAKGGGTVSTQQANSYWLTDIYNQYSKQNIVVVTLGTNDIGVGLTGQQLYDAMVAYINIIKSAGFEVIVGTVYPRSAWVGTVQDDYRTEYNQLIRDNEKSLGLLGIIDFANEKTMGSNSNVTNPVYYKDGTHPSPYGYELLATFAATSLNKILEQSF